MSLYQSLLDEVVALVKADRGFIVLYAPETGIPTQIVATHEIISALVFQPLEDMTQNHRVIWDYRDIQQALPLMAHEKQPLLTYNYDQKYFTVYPETIVPGPAPRSIIVVPLRSAVGLLWCDIKFLNGVFKVSDLEALVALVERNDRP